jgi:beta-N-acetylhexosaminidase
MSASAVGRVLLPGFAGTELPEWVAARLRAGLAGVCLFGPNIKSPRQLLALTGAIRACNPRALIALDEEGGDVTRLHYDVGSPSPGNAWLGRLDDVSRTEQVGAAIAAELAAAGCNLNLAPCADVNADADNPVIGVRSFGADAELVARHTAAWVRGHQSQGVAACVKHFPGHGDTSTDSHLALPVLDLSLDDLATRDLVPFRRAVDGGAWSVMTSHILLPRLDAERPATLSARVLDILRSDLGFDGAVVSDALDMAGASGDVGIPEAAVRSLMAGCDLLCIGTDNTDEQLDDIVSAVDAAVASERLAASRLDEAADRVAVVAARTGGPATATSAVGAAFSLDQVAAEFDVGAQARAAFARGAGDWAMVCLETAPNIAAGIAPWGPRAAIDAGDAGWPGTVVAVDPAGASAVLDRMQGEGVVLVGRANHRHSWVRDVVDKRRVAGPTVVVDMGWPADDRAYADIATFGASRLLGAALLGLLADLAGPGGSTA